MWAGISSSIYHNRINDLPQGSRRFKRSFIFGIHHPVASVRLGPKTLRTLDEEVKSLVSAWCLTLRFLPAKRRLFHTSFGFTLLSPVHLTSRTTAHWKKEPLGRNCRGTLLTQLTDRFFGWTLRNMESSPSQYPYGCYGDFSFDLQFTSARRGWTSLHVHFGIS